MLVGGCEGAQSTLAPAGPQAERLADLGWLMLWGALAILLLVAGLTAYAVLVPERRRRWLGHRRLIIAGGLAFPAISIAALLVYEFATSGQLLQDAGASGSLRIEVAGEQWWWRVSYPGAGDAVVTANEIHLPVGQQAAFVLTSSNVIHSFWIPSLGGKLDMIPGRENVLSLQAAKPGIYRGQCTEFCGLQHTRMAFYVVVHSEPEFSQWLEHEGQGAIAPRDRLQRRGRELFDLSGCGGCHAVRGTGAAGDLGPDLTHFGSRQSLGAGILPNNAKTVMAWIADAQRLKPGSQMPSFEHLAGDELEAIAAYLVNLK